MAEYASLRSAIPPYTLMLATQARNTVQSRMECALWEAIEIDGLIRRARDPVTGAVMRLASTPEIDSEDVRIQFPGEKELRLPVKYAPKKGISTGNDPSNPMIRILVGDAKYMVKQRPGSFEENTRLIRYVLEGLSAINHKWPLCQSPYFYSDIQNCKERHIDLPFDFPSDEELANL